MNHSNDCFSHSTNDHHHHTNSSSLYASIIDNHAPVIVPLLRAGDLPTPDASAISSSSSAFSYHQQSPYPPSEASTPGGQRQHSHQSNIISPYYPHPSNYGAIASPNIDFPPFWTSQWLFSSDIHQQTQDSIENALYCPSATVTGCNQLANRLNPITQPPAVHHHHQFAMPTNNQYSTRQYHHGAVRSNAPKKGGRRPKEYEGYEHSQLSEEDRDKRDKRRQRNKEAAARCRQRRLDLMQELQEQLNKMKCENDRQDEIIRSLKQQKSELEQLLRHHGCKNTDDMCEPATIVYQQVTRKRTAASLLPPNSAPKIPKCEPTLAQVASEVENLQRPKSLSIGAAHQQQSGGATSSLGADSRWNNNNPAGVPITTPSSGLGPSCGGGGGGGDFMLLNQPTGLTPMSNNANLTALAYPSHTLATPLDHELKNL